MKNIVIALLVVVVIVFGYMTAASKFRLKLEGIDGKTAKVTSGDLTIPINATGEIRPSRRVVIKSEASGEVLEVAKQPGDRVRAGDLLIRLQRDDEERNVRRAQLESDIAKAQLEEAKLILQQAETADLQAAMASVAQFEALIEPAKVRAERAKEDPKSYHEDERLQRVATFESQTAQLANAKAALDRARIAIPRARQAVVQREARFASTKSTLGDAEKRLSKTDIVSPVDGIVGQMRAQVGEVIQGGKTTITGGTELAVILDMNKLIARAEVDEADIGRVLAIAPEWARPDHPASAQVPADLRSAAETMEHSPVITVESFRGEEFSGVIERIFPEPTRLTGVVTYLVDVVIVSENRFQLLSGMRADVRFTSEHVENVVLCPNEAIREGPGGKLGVYVPKKDSPPEEHLTEFILCRFGLDNGNYSEVREGLTEGTKVYTRLPAKRDSDRDKKKQKRRG